MWKIVLSMFIGVIGTALYIGAQRTTAAYDNSRPDVMIFACVLVLGAVILFIVGLKDYFLREIIDALVPKKPVEK